jgi:trehalose 6-phosphate phosphatase
MKHASENLDAWISAREHAGRMLVALDFDGTLVPIVDDPDDAHLDPVTHAALVKLAARPDTDLAIVSGRALEDVRSRVAVDGVFYAGNHGLEIEGPGVQCVHAEASRIRPALAACADRLRPMVASLPGAILEDKGLTLSLHYRQVQHDRAGAGERLLELARAAAAAVSGVRVTTGKMIIELRPDVTWDKGRAVRFLLDTLEAGAGSMLPVIFIGDDVTDEDAFRAIAQRGQGIIVAADPPAATAARWFVKSPVEVTALLEALAHDVIDARWLDPAVPQC